MPSKRLKSFVEWRRPYVRGKLDSVAESGWAIVRPHGKHRWGFYDNDILLGESKSLDAAKKQGQTRLDQIKRWAPAARWSSAWEPITTAVVAGTADLLSPAGGDYSVRVVRSMADRARDAFLIFIDGEHRGTYPSKTSAMTEAARWVATQRPLQRKAFEEETRPAAVEYLQPRPSARAVGVPIGPSPLAGGWAKGTYVCTLVSPKSLSPVEIRSIGSRIIAGSPDGTRLFGSGYFGDEGDELGVDCTRQHMLPGLLNEQDRGKALGATLYIGGCITNTLYRHGDCTFSVEVGRSADASQVWASMVRHGLATGYSGAPREECEHLSIDDDVAEGLFDFEPDEVSIEPEEVYVCARGELLGNQMEYDTIAASGLVLHANDDLDDLVPIEPEVFAGLDLRYTHPELVSEWVWWGATEGTMAADDVNEEWLRRAVRGLPREARAIVRPELTFRARQLELDFGSAEQRPNPRAPNKMLKLWLKEYGPNSSW